MTVDLEARLISYARIVHRVDVRHSVTHKCRDYASRSTALSKYQREFLASIMTYDDGYLIRDGIHCVVASHVAY